MDTIKIDHPQTLMIAHRGVSGLELQNTNAAFVAAGNRSYFGIETDVHITADGKFVIIHDDNAKRVSGVDVIVEQAQLDKLQQIRLIDNDGIRRVDYVMPELSEYIGICKKYGKTAVLELKNKMEPVFISGILAEIIQLGYLEHTIFISFSWENLEIVRQLQPMQTLQYLTSQADNTLVARLAAHSFDLDAEYHAVTPELVHALHTHGRKINCWTCNNETDAEKLVSYGVDYITSNILE